MDTKIKKKILKVVNHDDLADPVDDIDDEGKVKVEVLLTESEEVVISRTFSTWLWTRENLKTKLY